MVQPLHSYWCLRCRIAWGIQLCNRKPHSGFKSPVTFEVSEAVPVYHVIEIFGDHVPARNCRLK